MVHSLETQLSHKEVLEIAQLTDQSPDFILRISDLDTAWPLLMANLENQGIVTEDNFEVLIDILDVIGATDALELVRNFTSSTFTDEKPREESGMLKMMEPENSLNKVTPVTDSLQQGARRRRDKKPSSRSHDKLKQGKPSPRGRSIACSWQDVTPLLESFGIGGDSSQRLSVLDAIVLHRIHLHENFVTPKNVVAAFLSRLMSFDYRSMRLFKELDQSEYFEEGKSSRYRAKTNIRSVHQKLSCKDFIHAIIENCDPFLQQEVLSKMSACQLAVPVLLPDVSQGKVTLLLWGLQRISKAWSNPKTPHVFEEAVVKFPFPVVAAIRFGNTGFSKSNILNKMLGSSQGNDDHPYFFSFEQDSKRSLLSKGTLEAVWYLPSGDKRCRGSFTEAICFLNLRGDATEYTKQRDFACFYSLVTVVFIGKTEMNAKHREMDEITKKSRMIVVMGPGDESGFLPEDGDDADDVIVINNRMSILDASQMNTLDISEKLCVEINSILQKPRNISDDLKSLTDTLSSCEEYGIDVDTHNEECIQAKKAAEGVLEACQEGPKAYKLHALPLQLNWQEWSKLDKDRSWKGAHGDVERELAKLNKEKEEQRQKQREIGLSREMKALFKELSNPSPTYKQFLVFWLQHSLNEISFASLRPLVDRLKAIRDEVRETAAKITYLRRKVGGDDVSNSAKQSESVRRQIKELTAKESKLQKDLAKKTEDFDARSLGFEHFVREFGQIYECFHNNQRRNETTKVPFDIKRLPRMAAEMLLSGHPLEIFDGDACHVPIKWVKGVLAAVRDLVGNASVYVISVIGIQSSGKSTLLNSMFGVRFAVSAGRCTRGVFLQMLPVSEDLKEEVDCDFIAVIDTEGLKAPEKALANRKNEDNELATFALCLSDMTLINIGGQTVGEDLSNILQISAHAFIRMKEVHLSSSCYLIQQFVADVTAKYRNQSSTQSILQKLDQAVVTAAIEERKHDQYRQFSDCFNIVNIDNETKHIQYIPSLWRSSMSAPNHEYSETVLRLKSSLLEEAKGNRRKQKISELANKIENVWNAIKQEDFVFNFCNTNEISQYNNFTRFYKRQQLVLTQEMINWELEAKQKIKNTPADNVNDRRRLLLQELDEKLASMVDQIKTSLEEELKVKDYESVRQHSTFFFRDLELVQSQTRETVRNMLNLESSIILNARTKEDQLLPQLIGELRQKVLTVAETMKKTLSQHHEEESIVEASQQAEKKTREIFEQEWSKQMTSFEEQYPTKSEDDIRSHIEKDIKRSIMECLQNTSLSKDMKELLNSHKLSALCQESPNVSTIEDISKASRLIGRCSREISVHVQKLQLMVRTRCQNETFRFSKDFVLSLKDHFKSILRQPCDGCKDKTTLLLCLSCSVIQTAHNATKTNVLDEIMRDEDLLTKLNRGDISTLQKIKDDVQKQLNKCKMHFSEPFFKKLRNLFGDFWASSHAQEQINENFHNQLRMKFLSDSVHVDKDRWYCPKRLKNFIEMAQELLMNNRLLDDRKRQQLLYEACSFFIQEAFQSEQRALAQGLSWRVVQVTLKCGAIEIVDQMNVFVEVLQDILPERVYNSLVGFSENMIDRLSRIPLTEDRRHSIDEFFIMHVPTLERENNDTLLSVIRDSRELFLGHIKSSGVYNTNLIRSLISNMAQELTRHNDLGIVEQSLVIAHVCSWALPICIRIELTFERSKSVPVQLETEKERLFLDFKSLCEGACQDKLAAKSFCVIIEESLKDSLKTRVCSALFERLSKGGDEIFCSRPRFLQVVLESLCEEENFNNYTQFLRQHTSFIQKWTLDFIANQCCDDNNTQISIIDIALYEINQLVRSTDELLEASLRHVIENPVSEASLFEVWNGNFVEGFERSLNSSLNEEKISSVSLQFLLSDCELFTNECKLWLNSNTKDLLLKSIELPDTSSVCSIRRWFDEVLPKKLHAILAESVRGCGSQCPFCKTFCDDTVKEHNVHMSNLHFPIGVGGWRGRRDKKLATNTCTAYVASEAEYYTCHCNWNECDHSPRPYKEYREDYPDWDIKPISNYEATLYWKWVLIRFNEDFAQYYNCKIADIPWGDVSKEEALRSIKNDDV